MEAKEELKKSIEGNKYLFYVIMSSMIGLQLITLLVTAGLWGANKRSERHDHAEECEMNTIDSTPNEASNNLTLQLQNC